MLLMFVKGIGALLPSVVASSETFFSIELADMEKEKEAKGNGTSGSQLTEELFDHSTSSVFCLDNKINSISLRERNADTLPDGYLDTLTPPPNASCC